MFGIIGLSSFVTQYSNFIFEIDEKKKEVTAKVYHRQTDTISTYKVNLTALEKIFTLPQKQVSDFLQNPILEGTCKSDLTLKRAVKVLLKNQFVPVMENQEVCFEKPTSLLSVSDKWQELKTIVAHPLRAFPDGNLISWARHAINVWNPETAQCIASHNPTLKPGKPGIASGIQSAIGLKNGFIAYSSHSDKDIKIWNPKTNQLTNLAGHSAPIIQLIELSSGQLASSSNDNTIRIWDLTTGNCLKTINAGTHPMLFALSNGTLIASYNQSLTIHHWDPKTGQCLTSWNGYFGQYNRFLEIKNNQILIYCTVTQQVGGDPTMRIYNLDAKKGASLPFLPNSANVQRVAIHYGITAAAYLSSTGLIAAGTKNNNQNLIKIWDPESGKVVKTFPISSSASSLLELSNGMLAVKLASTMEIWNVEEEKCIHSLHIGNSTVSSEDLLYELPNQRLVASMPTIGTKIWQMPCSKRVSTSASESLLPTIERAIVDLLTHSVSIDDSVEEPLICPLTLELFSEPVIDEHGHTFEKSAIEAHLQHDHRCPLNRQPLNSLTPNRSIKDQVDKLRSKPAVLFLPVLQGKPVQENLTKAKTYLEFADQLISDGDIPGALNAFESAFKLTNRSEDYANLPPVYESINDAPKAACAYLYLAKRQFQEGKFAQAKESLEKAVLNQRNVLSLKELQASSEKFSGNLDKAFELYQTLYQEYSQKNDQPSMIRCLEQALLCKPNEYPLYQILSSLYNDNQRKYFLNIQGILAAGKTDPAQAEKFFNSARDLIPISDLAYLAFLKQIDKQTDEAKKHQIYKELTTLYKKRGNIKDYEASLKKLIYWEEDRDFQELIDVYLSQALIQEAKKIYELWAKVYIDKDNSEKLKTSLGNLASSLGRLGSLMTGKDGLPLNEENNPDSSIFHHKAVELIEEGISLSKQVCPHMDYSHMKHISVSDIPLLKQLIDLGITESTAVTAEEKPASVAIALADAYTYNGQVEEAEKIYRKLYEKNPRDFTTAFAFGHFFARQKKTKESIEKYCLAHEIAILSGSNFEAKEAFEALKHVDPTFSQVDPMVKTALLTHQIAVNMSYERMGSDNSKISELQKEITLLKRELYDLRNQDYNKASTSKDNQKTSQKILVQPYQRQKIFSGHNHPISFLGYFFMKQYLASLDCKGVVKFWDRNGVCMQTLNLEREGKILELSSGELAISQGNKIIIWDFRKKDITGELKWPQANQENVEILEMFQLSNHLLLSTSSSDSIKLWDLNSCECVKSLHGHHSVKSTIEFQNNTFATIDSYSMKIWDSNSGDCLKTIKTVKGNRLHKLSTGLTVVICGNKATIYDVENDKIMKTVQHEGNIFDMLELKNGDILTADNVGYFVIWDPANDKIKKRIEWRKDGVFEVLDLLTGDIRKILPKHTQRPFQRFYFPRLTELKDTTVSITCGDIILRITPDFDSIFWDDLSSGECTAIAKIPNGSVAYASKNIIEIWDTQNLPSTSKI